jgi:pyridoxine/pyridoxamine 5'-phosphate oxidase
MSKQQIINAIEELQNYFAAKPYGWRANATAGQISQHEARETELESLVARLERMS